MGELALVGDHSTVPLTQISCNTVFSKSQNARKAGTLCNTNDPSTDPPLCSSLIRKIELAHKTFRHIMALRYPSVDCTHYFRLILVEPCYVKIQVPKIGTFLA